MKTALRRAFSLMLCVVMLVSCWVFTAPKADAASAGNYTITVDGICENDAYASGMEVKVYYKPTNGTGTETSKTIYSRSDNFTWDGTGNDDRNNVSIEGFPTKVEYKVKKRYSAGTLELYCNIYICGTYVGETNHEWYNTSGWKTWTWTAASGDYPHADKTSISGGSNVSVPTDGTSTNYSTAFKAGTVYDQYGVSWYQDATLSVSSHTGVSISSGKVGVDSSANASNNYNVTVTASRGSASASTTCAVSVFDYEVTFYDENGTTVLKAKQTIDYGGSATAPSNPSKAYDSSKHYAFSSWTGDSYTSITSGAQTRSVTASYTGTTHTNTSKTTTSTYLKTAATCTDAAVYYYKCTGCAYKSSSTYSSGSALGHTGDNVAHETLPANEKPGITYYECTRCHTCWGAVKNNDTYTKDLSNEQAPVAGEPNIDAVIDNTSAANVEAPAPAFNIFVDPSIGNYEYSLRGAGLKIAGSTGPYDFEHASKTDRNGPYYTVTQGMRFVGSMQIPTDVSYCCGAKGDNVITDFGYVWSQTSLIHNNINELEMNMPNVQKTSVKANNMDKNHLPAFDGSNWTGVTMHTDTTGRKTLTFNLVVNVRAGNWKNAYCARAYITYKYNGTEYTVYDSAFSSRDVAYIANAVVENPRETQRVKDFCTDKIIANLGYID